MRGGGPAPAGGAADGTAQMSQAGRTRRGRRTARRSASHCARQLSSSSNRHPHPGVAGPSRAGSGSSTAGTGQLGPARCPIGPVITGSMFHRGGRDLARDGRDLARAGHRCACRVGCGWWESLPFGPADGGAEFGLAATTERSASRRAVAPSGASRHAGLKSDRMTPIRRVRTS